MELARFLCICFTWQIIFTGLSIKYCNSLLGPIWQSHIQCVGNEKGLRWCPHRGFVDRYSDASWLLPLICDSHRDDASVFCFKNGNLSKFESVQQERLAILVQLLFSSVFWCSGEKVVLNCMQFKVVGFYASNIEEWRGVLFVVSFIHIFY